MEWESSTVAGVVIGVLEVLARPAPVALARDRGAVGANRLAAACRGDLGRRLTEANRGETVARVVVARPARGAVVPGCVNGLLTGLAEAQLGEACI